MNVKIADDKGKCEASVVAKGIVWAVNHGADVINISLEIREPSADLEKAVNYAWNQGTIIIASTSNLTSQSPVYPAAYEECLAVVATRQNGTIGPLTNYIDYVDVAAPGFDIYSTLPKNSYGYMTGTSFATAHVSGLAALIFSAVSDTNGNGLLNDEVRAIIEGSCDPIDNLSSMKGQINAAKAIVLSGESK
jgi:subtilisin family serine protease